MLFCTGFYGCVTLNGLVVACIPGCPRVLTEGITAEDIVELFRRDARARRELAVLLVSEPEVRLAVVNAVLREVATKEDLEKLRDEFRREMEALRQYIDRRVEELREYVDRRIAELKEYVDARFERIEAEIRELRGELRELNARLWWVVGTLIAGWLAVVIEQLLLHMLGW